jgi:hypothetical protein
MRSKSSLKRSEIAAVPLWLARMRLLSMLPTAFRARAAAEPSPAAASEKFEKYSDNR